MKTLLILILAFFLSSSAFAEQQDTKAAESEAVAVTDEGAPAEEEELICTRVPVTGSNMKRKTCRTKAQAEDERKRAKAFIDRIRMQPLTEGQKG
jgi:hypothetical protein